MGKLDHLGWVVHRTYELQGVRLGVRTTSEAFGAWMDEALAGFRVPGEAAPHYSVLVAREPGGAGRLGRGFHILYRGVTPLVRTLHLPTLRGALLAELESFRFPEREDAIYLRAGILKAGEQAVLVPSAVIPHLGRLGRRVSREGIMLPAAVSAAVDLASGRVIPVRPFLGADGNDIDRVDGNSDRLVVDEPISVDVVCTFATGQDSFIEPISRAVALHQLSAQVVNLPTIGGAALTVLGRLVAGARCYSLVVTDGRTMLEALSGVLLAETGPDPDGAKSRNRGSDPQLPRGA